MQNMYLCIHVCMYLYDLLQSLCLWCLVGTVGIKQQNIVSESCCQSSSTSTSLWFLSTNKNVSSNRDNYSQNTSSNYISSRSFFSWKAFQFLCVTQPMFKVKGSWPSRCQSVCVWKVCIAKPTVISLKEPTSACTAATFCIHPPRFAQLYDGCIVIVISGSIVSNTLCDPFHFLLTATWVWRKKACWSAAD